MKIITVGEHYLTPSRNTNWLSQYPDRKVFCVIRSILAPAPVARAPGSFEGNNVIFVFRGSNYPMRQIFSDFGDLRYFGAGACGAGARQSGPNHCTVRFRILAYSHRHLSSELGCSHVFIITAMCCRTALSDTVP